MKTSWPRVEARISRTFQADHSLPQFGMPERHRHPYWVEFGYAHEINPTTGVAKNSVGDLLTECDAVIARVADKYLNDVLPVTPTAEWLACWLLANVGCDENRVSYVWDFVVVRAYGCLEVRAQRSALTARWTTFLRGGHLLDCSAEMPGSAACVCRRILGLPA